MIASVTITSSREDIIGDAIRSVADWVDLVVLVDLGITDRTSEIAREIAGDKVRVVKHEWKDDTAEARNAGLRAATEMGATWAVILDTDERIHAPKDIREILATAPESHIHANHDSGVYGKIRYIKLPADSKYEGAVHEAYLPKVRYSRVVGTFSELNKTADQLRRRCESDLRILTRQTEREPNNSRAWYYLGQTLECLRLYPGAIDAYRRCAALPGWDEERAWACYRASVCAEWLQDWEQIVSLCAQGLGFRPGIAELAWFAGLACYKLGRFQHAVEWGELAVVWGHHAGRGRECDRLGFREPRALYEAPYDVLRWAYRSLGNSGRASLADIEFERALAARRAAA